MTEASEVHDLDLFGKPIVAIRDRRGRPSFKKSDENQQLVALLVAANWTQAKIANYIGCDEKTLRKNFSRELQHGQDMIEAEALSVLYVEMRKGNVSATKRLQERIDAAQIKIPAAPPKRPKPERLGKKATLDQEAKSPSGSWSDVLN